MQDLFSPSAPNQASATRPSSRELEAKFYREIGLSAVAAALSLQLETRQLRPQRLIESPTDDRRLERRAG